MTSRQSEVKHHDEDETRHTPLPTTNSPRWGTKEKYFTSLLAGGVWEEKGA